MFQEAPKRIKISRIQYRLSRLSGSFLDLYGGAQLIDNNKVLKVKKYSKKVNFNSRTLLRCAVLFASKHYLVTKKHIP